MYTWLRTTMGRELGHLRKRESRRAQLEVLVDVSALELRAGASWHGTPEEQLIEREDEAEVERVTCAVLARLSEPQRAIAALHGRGRKRPDIAEHLGMTPRSVKRALERVLSVSRDELVRLAGRGCESGEPLVARFAFGLATPREERQAQLHLATGPRCDALYSSASRRSRRRYTVTEHCPDGSTAQTLVSVIGGHEEESESGVSTLDSDFVTVLIRGFDCDFYLINDRGSGPAEFSFSPSLQEASVAGTITTRGGRSVNVDVTWAGTGELET